MQGRQPNLPNLFVQQQGTALAEPDYMAAAQRFRTVLVKVAPVFNDLPVHLQTLVRLCDGTRTAAQLATASGLKRSHAIRLLEQLADVGLLERLGRAAVEHQRTRLSDSASAWAKRRPSAPVASPAYEATAASVEISQALYEDALVTPAPIAEVFAAEPLPAFSDDEEAFFARSIDHLVGDDFYG